MRVLLPHLKGEVSHLSSHVFPSCFGLQSGSLLPRIDPPYCSHQVLDRQSLFVGHGPAKGIRNNALRPGRLSELLSHNCAQLYFAALLRLPRQMSKAAKLERVSTVITALGLDKCKNTIIGGHHRPDPVVLPADTYLAALVSGGSLSMPLGAS